MISGVTYPNIKPIRTYPENSNRHTTLTSFDEVLNDTKDTVTESDTVKTASSSKTSSESDKTAATASTSSDDSIIYTNPKTGDTYRYIDVAKDDDNSNTTSASGTSSASTTSASSMKKTKYNAYFQEAAKKYGVSESLLKAIAKAESNFNANDVSSAGAIGVMQLMPATASELGVTNPYDAEQNIMGGAKCISQKLDEFDGNVRLALAAYNAGSGAVKRNGGVPSYCKTYVNRVLSYKSAFETADAV